MATRGGIKAAKAYAELYADDTKLTAGLKKAQVKLQAFAKSVTAVGTKMVKLAAIGAAPLALGTAAAAKFGKQMAMVSTMVDEPQKHMATFTKGIKKMAVEMGEGTETLSKGLYDILSASIEPAKALDVLAVSTRAAKAGLTDTGVAADAITTILNSYGINAENAADVSDWLFQVVRAGKTTFAELAPSIGKVSSIAANAGLSMDELGASISTMTRNGVQTENAMTAVASVIKSFINPSKEAEKEAAKLGINLSAVTLETRGLRGVFEDIAGLPPDAIAKLFPSIRALRGVLPALGDLEGFTKDLNDQATRTGKAGEAYDKMAATIAFAFGKIKQAGVEALRVIGEALAPDVSQYAERLQMIVKTTIKWMKENKDLIKQIAKGVVVIGTLGSALVGVAFSIGVFGVALGGLASIVGIVGTLVGGLAGLISGLILPVGGATAAFTLMGGTIGQISKVAGDAIGWLTRKFDILKEDALVAFQAIKDAMAAEDIGLAARILWLTLKKEFSRGVNFLRGYWIDFKSWFIDIWTKAIYGVLKIGSSVWTKLQQSWNSLIAGMAMALNEFTADFRQSWNKLNAWVESLFTRILMWANDADKEARDAAVRQIETRVEKENKAIRKAADQENILIDRQRDQKNKQLENELQTDIESYKSASQAERDVNKKRYEQEKKDSEDALIETKRRWEAVIKEAQEARTEADRRREEERQADEKRADRPDLKSVEQAAEETRSKFNDIMKTMKIKADELKMTALGTFNISAIQSLAGGPTEQRIAVATEQTAENTNEIIRQVKKNNRTNNGATFS